MNEAYLSHKIFNTLFTLLSSILQLDMHGNQIKSV
jgi:hypothetical protein